MNMLEIAMGASPHPDPGGTTSYPTKQPKDGCQVVGYKPASWQVAGYLLEGEGTHEKRVKQAIREADARKGNFEFPEANHA
ncbi:hypothetical protein GALL_34260 [mine drainage metagenome]|uniref:Uncharacterized protein n=1 Tax=mine drainage metagenome TaxID=410659 RepID=A0A1J5THY7_9ZZZZ